MKVVAIQTRADSHYAGYDGEKRRKHGEVFDWPDGVPLGKWVIPEGKPIPEPVSEISNAEKVSDRGMTLREATQAPELPTVPKRGRPKAN